MGSILAFVCSVLIILFIISLNKKRALLAGISLSTMIFIIIGQRIHTLLTKELQAYEIFLYIISIIVSFVVIYIVMARAVKVSKKKKGKQQ